ncbi:uncharacterized protein LOC115231788 [Octopus sinensis]|uniref:Uncharacterized protein LOC115231788 n=1 Tax=Octopus sinensis TaxID=2607531 RepID=A0A6P7TVW8_9MOLL|nr:uncharacterized protein LOC115231788 [Octopus sinensis]
MLPSTFKNETKEQEMARKRLKVKLEMAKFLQNTLEESVTVIKKNDTTRTSSVEEFVQFMKTEEDVKLRLAEESGEVISNTDRLVVVLNEEEAIKDDHSEKSPDISALPDENNVDHVNVQCDDLETIENLLIQAVDHRNLSLSSREFRELQDGITEYQQVFEAIGNPDFALSSEQISDMLRLTQRENELKDIQVEEDVTSK